MTNYRFAIPIIFFAVWRFTMEGQALNALMTTAANAGFTIDQPETSHEKQWTLRFDWTNLTPTSELTQRMLAHQTNCSLPLGNFIYRNRYGLGSDLHVWGQALCNGMESHHRIRTIGPWAFVDQEKCGGLASPMACYFQTELLCPDDDSMARQYPTFAGEAIHNISRPNGKVKYDCESIMTTRSVSEIRSAGVEFLFGRASRLLVQEAERQLALVFQNESHVPKDLITVHIRWGDKKQEMKLVPMADYIKAIQKVLDGRSKTQTGEDSNEANIFLATEDPSAVEAFRQLAPPEWNIYLDQYYIEMLPHRIDEFNGNPKMSKHLNGRTGLVALGSLLVAMEANDFILTTASNWSRLLDRLRKSALNPRCNDCTTMIDLRQVTNEW
jgi:hypothetical protein